MFVDRRRLRSFSMFGLWYMSVKFRGTFDNLYTYGSF